MSLLVIKEISKGYDGVQALDRVSMNVAKGTIKGLIGPNGAGKSTLFHLITGVERPTSGKIYFKGIEITSLEPHEISALGLARTFQTVQTLANMTLVENVMIGMHVRLKEGPLSSGLWLPWVKKVEREALEEAKEILEMVGLLGRWKSPASQLPLGQQKLLELGRALAMKPEIILLDEPASGLTSPEVQRLLERICQFRKGGMTFFVVEHHMDMVMEIADEVAVLHHGQLIAEGSPDLLRRNTEVIEAYLKGRKVNA